MATKKAAAVTREYPDDRMLSFHQWCKLNDLSPATGRRIISAGAGPNVVQLSPRRIGITVGDNRAWRTSKTRAFMGGARD